MDAEQVEDTGCDQRQDREVFDTAGTKVGFAQGLHGEWGFRGRIRDKADTALSARQSLDYFVVVHFVLTGIDRGRPRAYRCIFLMTSGDRAMRCLRENIQFSALR